MKKELYSKKTVSKNKDPEILGKKAAKKLYQGDSIKCPFNPQDKKFFEWYESFNKEFKKISSEDGNLNRVLISARRIH